MRELFNHLSDLDHVFGKNRANRYLGVLETELKLSGQEFVLRMLDNLLNQRELNGSVISQLSELARRENWVLDSVERVDRGRQVLQRFLSKDNVRVLLEDVGNPRLIIYGSLQYGDPVNLDIDLQGVTEEDIPEDIPGSRFLAAKVRLSSWLNYVMRDEEVEGVGGHFSLCSERMLMNADQLWIKDPKKYDPLDVGVVITGGALFEQDRKWLETFRRQLARKVNRMPLIRAYTNVNLENALEIRKERRESI